MGQNCRLGGVDEQKLAAKIVEALRIETSLAEMTAQDFVTDPYAAITWPSDAEGLTDGASSDGGDGGDGGDGVGPDAPARLAPLQVIPPEGAAPAAVARAPRPARAPRAPAPVPAPVRAPAPVPGPVPVPSPQPSQSTGPRRRRHRRRPTSSISLDEGYDDASETIERELRRFFPMVDRHPLLRGGKPTEEQGTSWERAARARELIAAAERRIAQLEGENRIMRAMLGVPGSALVGGPNGSAMRTRTSGQPAGGSQGSRHSSRQRSGAQQPGEGSHRSQRSRHE